MATGIVTLTDATFDEEVRGSDVPVLVDFWAEWCGPCKMIAPIVEELASDYEGALKVGKLDIEEQRATALRFNVMTIPTLILFKDGEPAKRLVGARGKRHLVEELADFLPADA